MRSSSSSLLLFFGLVSVATAIEIQWPTSMDTSVIQSLEDYVQPVGTGKIESGCFGMVREEGRRFHEGIDIRPYQVKSNGEPADYIYAAMSGKVAYINNNTNGPYGRYIILVHDNAEIGLYSLYAHLAKIDTTLRVGDNVARGKAIAIMGHTSSPSSPIPVERGHLHFEVGLRLADSFNAWYKSRFNYKSDPNLHGLWNGQNLTGFDPTYLLGKKNVNTLEVVKNLPTALAVTIRTPLAPDFVSRYPGLVQGDPKTAEGWYVEFAWHGLPKRWVALPAGSPQIPSKTFEIVGINQQYKNRMVARKILTNNGLNAGENLIQNLEILLSNSR